MTLDPAPFSPPSVSSADENEACEDIRLIAKKKRNGLPAPLFECSGEFILHCVNESPGFEPAHDFSVTRVRGVDEITEPPTAFETCVGDNCAVDVGDVFGKFEEPKARFAALLVCHYKDDAMTREQPALSRDGIVITKLP